jgi:hypothetical protein
MGMTFDLLEPKRIDERRPCVLAPPSLRVGSMIRAAAIDHYRRVGRQVKVKSQ